LDLGEFTHFLQRYAQFETETIRTLAAVAMAMLTLAVFCSMFVDSGTQELRAKGRRKKTQLESCLFSTFFLEPQMFQKDGLSSHGPDVFCMINLSILTL
jgi:predicted exporter